MTSKLTQTKTTYNFLSYGDQFVNLQLEIQPQSRCQHKPLYWSGHILVNNIALEPVTLPQLMPHTREMLENVMNRKKKVNISEKVNQNIAKWITS
jgi:hypothetical protein